MAFTDEVRVPITAKDAASETFRRVQAAGERMTKGFKNISDAMTPINQGLELLAKAARLANAGIRATAGNFANFETALVGVGKTTDLSERTLERFGNRLQGLSTTIPIATNDLLKIAETAGQLGVTGVSNLILFTETMAKVGVATNLSANEAATGFTRILNITGQSITVIDRFASTVVKLGNTFPATEAEIVRMTSEVARATAQFGVSAQQAAALGTALKSVGVQAQLGGSVVGKAMREIDKAVRTGGVALEEFAKISGVTGKELKATFEKDAVAAFELFTKGLKRMGDEGKSISIALERVGLMGDEVNKVLPVLANRADLVSKALRIASEEFETNTALNEEARKAFATLSSEFNKFKNSVVSLGADIGAILAPAIKGLLSILTSMSEAIRFLIDDTSKLTAAFKFLAGAIALAVLAINPAIFGVLLISFQALVPVLLNAGIAMAAFAVQSAIVGARLTVLAVGFGLVAAGIELVVLNTTKLGNVWDVVFNSILASIELARSQVLNLGNAVFMILDLVGATETAAGGFAQVAKEQDALFASAAEKLAKVEQASKDLDVGFAAGSVKDLFKLISEAEEGFGAVGEAAEKATARAKIQAEESAAATAAAAKLAAAAARTAIRDQKRLEDAAFSAAEALIAATRNLQVENFKADATTRQRIEVERLARLQMVDDFVAKTKAAGKVITAEQQKQIDAFKEAANQESEIKLTAKGIGAESPLGGGIVEAGADAATAMAAGITSSLEPIGAMMQAAKAVVGAIQAIIDFIPQILDAVANLFTSLTELPGKIVASLGKLFDGITQFISDFIPNLIQGIGDIIESAVNFLAEGLPDAVVALGEKIPEFLTGFVERLPELVQKMALGLIRSSTTMGVQFTIAIIKGVPKLVTAIVKESPRIVMALVDGLIEGFKELANVFSNALGLGDIFNIDLGPAEEQLKSLGENISRSTSNLFKVVDLEAAARGLDVADRIRDAIGSSLTRARNIFQKLWDALVKVWEFIRDKILMPIFNFLRDVWLLVWEKILKPMINAIREVWLFIWDKILKPAWEAVQAVFELVIGFLSDTWDSIMDAVMTTFKFVGKLLGTVWNAAKKIFTAVGRLLKNTFKIFQVVGRTVGRLLKNVFGVFETIWRTLMDLFQGKINIFQAAFEIGQAIFDGFVNQFKIVIDAFKNIGAVLVDNLMIVFNAFKAIGEAYINSWRILIDIFKEAGQFFVDGFMRVVNLIRNVFEQAIKPYVALFNGLKSIFEKAIAPVKSIFDNFKFPSFPSFSWPAFPSFSWPAIPKPNWLGDIGGLVTGPLESLTSRASDAYKSSSVGKATTSVGAQVSGGSNNVSDTLSGKKKFLAMGGMVTPEYLANGGSVPSGKFADGILYAQSGALARGTDTVAAMLTPGEFVVNREATRENIGLLSFINQTRGPVVPVERPTNISVVMNVKSDLSADAIRREVIPTLEKELRRKSLAGKFVIAQQGIRSQR